MRVDSSGSSDWFGVPVAPVPGIWCIRRLLLALAVGVLLPSGQAVAQESAAGQAPVQPVVAADRQAVQSEKTGKVCQYEEVTGSRMKKRLCYTPEQWAARERAAKEMTREMDGKPVGKDANGG